MSDSVNQIIRLVDRCVENVMRAGNLIKYHKSDSAAFVETTSPVFDDLFRAAVVFLHAALEDFLRGVGRLRLPSCEAKILDRVPIAQNTPSLEPKKYLLGELVRHRSKTVDEVISESIGLYLERRTFNSAAEVVAFMADLTIPTAPFESVFADIDQMMKRRHRIVHQADHDSLDETRPSRLTMIDVNFFMRAITAVQLFALEMQFFLLPIGARDETRAGIIQFEKHRAKVILESKSPDEHPIS